jgi:2-keto-3-deoxy-L-rhamnonate aldolase RhmA
MGHCLPIIRVPSHDVAWIKWALDSGAAGIVIPMVNTAAEMRQIIDRAVYPPVGSRSFGPFNAPFAQLNPADGFPEYYQRAKSGDIAVLPIIESREGVQNADEILNVPGVTGVFIGPYDLRLSLGVPGGIDGPEDVFVEAIEKVIAAAKKAGKVVGSMGVGEEVSRKRAEQGRYRLELTIPIWLTSTGMHFLLSSLDYSALVRGFKADLDDARRGVRASEI